MVEILKVKSVTDKVTIQDELCSKTVARYLTLSDLNPGSENCYYICLTGPDAEIDWQEDDLVMVELSLLAYNNKGRWHKSHFPDLIKIIDIDIVKIFNYEERTVKKC